MKKFTLPKKNVRHPTFTRSLGPSTPRPEATSSMLVAPGSHPIDVKQTPSGAKIGKHRYLFANDHSIEHESGPVSFDGKVGYGEPGAVALFDGWRITYGGLGIKRLSGDFGMSARRKENGVRGRFAGRKGDEVGVRIPPEIDTSAMRVRVDGELVNHEIVENFVTFRLEIDGSDGVKS